MKPTFINSLFKIVRKILAMDFTKDEQGVKSFGSKGKVSRYRLHEACSLHTAGSPSETELAALVAYDRGDPASLDELVKQGYVFGTLQEVARVWHEMSLRDAAWLAKRESVANSAAAEAREAAIANALDPSEAIDFSDTADGWFKISPYGQFRGKVPGRPQTVSQENAAAMVEEFNSVLGKLGRAFRGVPIYHGHPDVDPEIWTDDRRIGKITKLEARPDGLWGLAEWNSIGQENKAEGWWIYPSPRWDAPAGKSSFAPDRLISIGLTNTPRILESEPVFNSLLDNKNNIMDPTLIREKLGLAPEATDEEVLAKIDSLIAAATEKEAMAPELENAKTTATDATKAKDDMACALTTAETNIVNLREAHNNALLDLAERDGKITKAERPAWQTKLTGDKRDEAVNSLTTMTPKLNTQALGGGQSRQDREQSDTMREQVANAVTELQQKRGLSYVDAWSTVKKDAKFATYFNRES
jgi:hypothetical protein